MSDDNLEALDNASLRKKCLEYGLPNVPITDTSRKLLIRKLRVAMTGEPADKKKNRRETIHVSKIPSPIEATTENIHVEEAPKRPPSRINRRTIAATSVTSTVDDTTLGGVSKPTQLVDKRRSVRQPEPVVSIPVSQKRKTDVLLEDEDYDEDEDDVILIAAAEEGERDIVIPRARRSVSLTKTGVVTTSYSQETEVLPPTVNETESESDNDFISKYTSTYEPLIRPPQSQLPRNTAAYGLSQQPKVIPDAERISNFRTSTVNRTSIEPERIYPTLPTLSSLSSLPSSRYSSLGSGYSGNSSSTTTTNTSTTRRFTTGGTGYGVTPDPVSKYTSLYEEDDVDDESVTPYLSDFARKLERLKAEPLAKGMESPRHIPNKRETPRYQSSIMGRRSTTQKESVSDSFVNLFHALDRKYHLKRNFAILFVIILLVFTYIVFVR